MRDSFSSIGYFNNIKEISALYNACFSVFSSLTLYCTLYNLLSLSLLFLLTNTHFQAPHTLSRTRTRCRFGKSSAHFLSKPPIANCLLTCLLLSASLSLSLSFIVSLTHPKSNITLSHFAHAHPLSLIFFIKHELSFLHLSLALHQRIFSFISSFIVTFFHLCANTLFLKSIF